MRIATILKKYRYVILIFACILLAALLLSISFLRNKPAQFDGQWAYKLVRYQVELGPRTLGSVAHDQEANWIVDELKKQNWKVEVQEATISGQPIKNIIGKRGEGEPWIIIGSHYDSRPIADRDNNPENRALPVPGANDGASSTAVLLEIARVLPEDLKYNVWLVFFDAEDIGERSGNGWATGSEYFVSQLKGKPDSVVVLDMIGDKNLDIYMEGNSNRALNSEIWGVANSLGYTQFIPEYKYNIIDDHIPFIKAGIKAVDVIDINYPAWHTTGDTLDKISANSLKVVGDTILEWLKQYPINHQTIQ